MAGYLTLQQICAYLLLYPYCVTFCASVSSAVKWRCNRAFLIWLLWGLNEIIYNKKHTMAPGFHKCKVSLWFYSTIITHTTAIFMIILMTLDKSLPLFGPQLPYLWNGDSKYMETVIMIDCLLRVYQVLATIHSKFIMSFNSYMPSSPTCKISSQIADLGL